MLRVGQTPGGTNNRSFVQFLPDDAARYATIQTASLNLYNVNAGSCTPREMYAKRLVTAFGGATTWNNQPTWDAATWARATFAHGATGCANAWGALSTGGDGTTGLVDLVSRWMFGEYENDGMLLAATSPTDSTYYKSFNSDEGEAGDGTQPHLDIVFTRPAAPTVTPAGSPGAGSYTFTVAQTGATNVAVVVTTTSTEAIQMPPLTAVTNAGATNCRPGIAGCPTGVGSVTVSGTASPFTVTVSGLAANTAYYLHVRTRTPGPRANTGLWSFDKAVAFGQTPLVPTLVAPEDTTATTGPRPVLSASYDDPDGTSGRVRFIVSHRNAAGVSSLISPATGWLGSTVPDGSTSTLTVPVDLRGAVSWYAVADDGSVLSAASETDALYVGTAYAAAYTDDATLDALAPITQVGTQLRAANASGLSAAVTTDTPSAVARAGATTQVTATVASPTFSATPIVGGAGLLEWTGTGGTLVAQATDDGPDGTVTGALSYILTSPTSPHTISVNLGLPAGYAIQPADDTNNFSVATTADGDAPVATLSADDAITATGAMVTPAVTWDAGSVTVSLPVQAAAAYPMAVEIDLTPDPDLVTWPDPADALVAPLGIANTVGFDVYDTIEATSIANEDMRPAGVTPSDWDPSLGDDPEPEIPVDPDATPFDCGAAQPTWCPATVTTPTTVDFTDTSGVARQAVVRPRKTLDPNYGDYANRYYHVGDYTARQRFIGGCPSIVLPAPAPCVVQYTLTLGTRINHDVAGQRLTVTPSFAGHLDGVDAPVPILSNVKVTAFNCHVVKAGGHCTARNGDNSGLSGWRLTAPPRTTGATAGPTQYYYFTWTIKISWSDFVVETPTGPKEYFAGSSNSTGVTPKMRCDTIAGAGAGCEWYMFTPTLVFTRGGVTDKAVRHAREVTAGCTTSCLNGRTHSPHPGWGTYPYPFRRLMGRARIKAKRARQIRLAHCHAKSGSHCDEYPYAGVRQPEPPYDTFRIGPTGSGTYGTVSDVTPITANDNVLEGTLRSSLLASFRLRDRERFYVQFP